jgi:hypothetical protein
MCHNLSSLQLAVVVSSSGAVPHLIASLKHSDAKLKRQVRPRVRPAHRMSGFETVNATHRSGRTPLNALRVHTLIHP